MFKLFGKKEETVSRAVHDRMVGDLRDDIVLLGRLANKLKERRDELAAQLLAARAEAEANKVDAEELAAWRKYGQMRDPATGRLIPRVKAEAV